jgi:hypothetical protein
MNGIAVAIFNSRVLIPAYIADSAIIMRYKSSKSTESNGTIMRRIRNIGKMIGRINCGPEIKVIPRPTPYCSIRFAKALTPLR